MRRKIVASIHIITLYHRPQTYMRIIEQRAGSGVMYMRMGRGIYWLGSGVATDPSYVGKMVGRDRVSQLIHLISENCESVQICQMSMRVM